MKKIRRHIFVLDIVILVLSGFIFLYLSPSVEVRQRLIYIIPQMFACAVLVFGSRFVCGVYKEIHFEAGISLNPRLFIKLIVADVLSGIVFYLVQLIIPAGPIRITFVRVACIIGFNLLGAMLIRLMYQSVFEFASEYIESSDKY